MVKEEDKLKQKLLKLLEENHSKRQYQAYINYANCTLAGLTQHLYDNHGTISPIYIEEIEQKTKQ